MPERIKYKKLIIFISIVLPLAVGMLFSVNLKDLGFDVTPLKFLPPIYASINGVTSIFLVGAVIAIKYGKRELHENLMKTCVGFSVLFLMMYIAYHMTSESTPFGGKGAIRTVYFTILVSHVLLSIAIIPLVLFTYVRALSEQFDQHRKIAKITFPLWLYVAVSGVVVYLMISPYYV